MVEQPTPIEGAGGALAASTRLLTLSQGIYRFSVAPGSPTGIGKSEHLTLPAVYIALAPDTPAKAADLLPGPSTTGTWLCEAGNLVFAGVSGSTAKFLMTSIPATGGEELIVEMERVDDAAALDGISAGPMSSRKRAAPQAIDAVVPRPTPASEPSRKALRLQIVAHLRNRGDMTFIDVPWAGRIGNGLWVEAFAIRPLEGLTPADIEYRALTASGFDTPWVSGGESCGTRGKADPLVAFAARLKPSLAEPRYELEYSGYFRSGALVGPVRNGAPCRSTLKGDPLEGIQLCIVERKSGMPNGLAARFSRGASSEQPGEEASLFIPEAPTKRRKFKKIAVAKITPREDRQGGKVTASAENLRVAAARKITPVSRRPATHQTRKRKPPAAIRAAATKAAVPGKRKSGKVKASPSLSAKASAVSLGAKKSRPIPATSKPRKTGSAAKTARRPGAVRKSRRR